LDRPAAAEIDGDELALWLGPLIALAAEVGSTVAVESIASGADGYYRPKTKAIVVEVAHSLKSASRRSCTSSLTPSDWATAISRAPARVASRPASPVTIARQNSSSSVTRAIVERWGPHRSSGGWRLCVCGA
jgi:hypothetical protein